MLLTLLTSVVTGFSQGFSDDFTRGTDPGPLTPWVVYSGAWKVSGGTLIGGTNGLNTFAFTYITNSWTNYTVQARIRFSSTSADGGGIGGRLNPSNGGHYAAWVSPENSPGGSRTLELVKFQDWAVYEYTNNIWQALQVVTVPSVGTNWHSLRLDFQGNLISVYYDSNLVASATDNLESNPEPYGGAIVDMSTANTPYNMFVDDLSVTPLPSTLGANNDLYVVTLGNTLNVAAPGVLGNDTAGASTNLTAVKLSNPAHGTVTLNSNGSLTYVPSNNFVGIDGFTYQATDGITSSAPAIVSVDVTPATNNFFENFSRSGNVNPLAPWVTGLGDWTVSGGVLLGAAAINDDYSDTYIPLKWGDFSIQTRFQLPSSAWACGLSGRMDPRTGARYVVNIYPENSQLGPRKLRVIKFLTWENWGPTYTALALVDMPAVGTSYHTLKVNYYGNQIDVYYDGSLLTHVVDNNFLGVPAYRTGSAGAHMYMYGAYQATFDDLTITALPAVNMPPVLPVQTDLITVPLATIVVTNTATDPDYPTNSLTYSLQSAPSGASIDTNGIITWTPTVTQDLSTNVFTTIVTDYNPTATNSQHLSATNTFSVVVNDRPLVTFDSASLIQEGCVPANQTVDSGETVTMLVGLRNQGPGTATNLVATLLNANGVASGSSPQNYGTLIPGGGAVTQAFTFTAVSSCGATITPTFSLTDGTNVLASTGFNLSLGQNGIAFTQAFDTVTAPALPSGWTTSTTGAQPTWVTATPSNSTPPNAAFSADAASVGVNALVSPVITLAPGVSQLSFANNWNLEVNNATEGFDGGVLEIKIGTNAFVDILAAGGSFITNGYDHILSTNYANPLGGRQAWSGSSGGYVTTLVNLPSSAAGKSIQLQWRCATDNGNGGAGWRIDSIGIISRTCCSNSSIFLSSQPDRTIPELATLVVTNAASGSGAPFGYNLINPPVGATIDTNGIITWTPTEAQGPSTNIITTVVTNSTTPTLSATNSFAVVVTEINSAPVLPAQTNRTTSELSSISVTNTASDPDVPAGSLTYQLVNPPTGATVNTNGIISWTPSEAQGPGTYTIKTIVSDSGIPPLSATNSFTITVNEVNSPPSLPVQNNLTISELSSLVVTNTATDPDLPTNTLSYQLIAPPLGATIDSSGVIRWTPSESQGPGAYALTTVVIDNGTPPLAATNSFTVTVTESNAAPILPNQTNRIISELTALQVTNTATDFDLPANALVYQLMNPPTGATITGNGIINWTPSEAQGPGTNLIVTVVTDNGTPPRSATNSFTVAVTESNSPPVLSTQPDVITIGLTPVIVTNAAVDSDLPLNTISYILVDSPPGANIDTNGIIRWTPALADIPSTNLFTSVATDFNPWAVNETRLSATNQFQVIVQSPAAPAPLIESIVCSNGDAILTWSAVPGRNYRVEYIDDFNTTNWAQVQPPSQASNSSCYLSAPTGSSNQRFYRVVLLP